MIDIEQSAPKTQVEKDSKVGDTSGQITADEKSKGWALILNSVRTPLGFFTLIALILDGFLLVIAASTEITTWPPLVLLWFLVACVFAIVWKKPYALYHPKDLPQKAIRIILLFPIKNATKVELEVEKCFVDIRDKNGKKKPRITPNLVLGQGGWNFELTEEVEPSDSVSLELTERSGRKWRVNPFMPYERTVLKEEIIKL